MKPLILSWVFYMCFSLLVGWHAGKQRSSSLTDRWFCFTFWFLSSPCTVKLAWTQHKQLLEDTSSVTPWCCFQVLRCFFYWADFWPTSSSWICWFRLIPQPTILLHLYKIALNKSLNKSPLSGRGEVQRVIFREVFLLEISESATNVIYKKVNVLLKDLDCPFLQSVLHCNSEEWNIKMLLKAENFPRIMVFSPPPELPALCSSISSDRHCYAAFSPGLRSAGIEQASITFWHHPALQWRWFPTLLENRLNYHLLPAKSVLMFPNRVTYCCTGFQTCMMDSLTIHEINCVSSNWEYGSFSPIFLQFPLE